MAQHLGAQRILVGGSKDIATVGIEQAHVDVHAVAGFRVVGLGHERRFEAMVDGDALDQALEQHRAVARLEHVAAVYQVDLELPRGALLQRRVQREVLDGGRGLDVAQEPGVLVELRNRIHLARGRAFAGFRRAGRLHPAQVVPRAIDDIELELQRDDGREPHRLEALNLLREDVARVGEEGAVVLVAHGHQQLSLMAIPQPGRRHQGAGNRAADLVAIADVQAQAGLLDRVAGDIQREDRAGEIDAVDVGLFEIFPGNPLAAQHAIEVAQQQIDAIDSGVTRQEVTSLVDGKGGHDVTCDRLLWSLIVFRLPGIVVKLFTDYSLRFQVRFKLFYK